MSFNEILKKYEKQGYKKEGKRKTKLAEYVLLHKERERGLWLWDTMGFTYTTLKVT